MPYHFRVLRGPRKMFSATVRSGTSVVSCVTVAIPDCIARAASPNLNGASPRTTLPASGASCPEITRSSVDLPDPFSPTSAWISPP